MNSAAAAYVVLFSLTASMERCEAAATREGTERLLIDEALGGIERPFGRYPETISFGPTGRRLWVNYLEAKPGFTGRMDFVHRLNMPLLFMLRVKRDGQPVDWRAIRHVWYPSHLLMEFQSGGIRLREWKFITWDDVAVDTAELANGTTDRLRIEYRTADTEPGPSPEQRAEGRLGAAVEFRFGAVPETAAVGPGETVRLKAGFAAGFSGEQGIGARLDSWLRDPEPVRRQVAEYQRWFDSAPTFACNEPLMNRVWAYRWYLLRRNLAHPAAGNLPHPFYLEGRGHKMSSDPWEPRGWEFSKLIPFSSPMHLLEGRWHPDTTPCEGEIDNLIENRSTEGLFQCATVGGRGSYYANFVAWAVRELALARPEVRIDAGRLEALKENVRAWLRLFDPDGDLLPHITGHNRTGKEYQPSFFYFDDFPGDPGSLRGARLERVDAASYLCMNADAVADLCARAGDTDGAGEFSRIAQGIAAAALAGMWDSRTHFFYDIRESDGEKAMVKNVVGFDPFLAGIGTAEHLGAFEHLWKPEEFRTPWPVPSVSRDCPAFAPDASWFGSHPKGAHGAMWNGPTWPFTNSTVLMSLARATRLAGHRFDAEFGDLFRRYTELHFRAGGERRPLIVEHYDPITGEPISQEEDYFHSSWIDLVVTGVAGLMPSGDGRLRLDPIDCGLEYFVLGRVPYRGYSLEVVWKSAQSRGVLPDEPDGFSVRVDGSMVIHRPRLEPAEWAFE